MPRLLETYEEARMLLEAKGWGVSKAAEHLSEMPGLASFNISQATLSRKTTPGSKVPIEPEVAAAVEGMQTWGGYERQTEIVTRGLLALHGDPPIVDVDRLATELREHLPASELTLKLVQALEEKASARATRGLFERIGRLSWKQIAISAGSGALVALLLVPLLSAHAFPAPAAGPLVVIIPPGGPDTSPVRFEPGSLLALSEWGEKVPEDQLIPKRLLPGQKAPPCDTGLREEAINAGCWTQIAGEPPCGRLFRHDNKCYRPVAADPKKPIGPTP